VNGQAAPALPALLSSPALQHSLSILDLSQSPLSSLPSDFSMLGNLTELHVPSAGLSGSFPTSLPGGLLVLDASNNTNLGGTLPSALCGSSILRTCSLASTGFSNDAAGSCGPCTFS
jgi:Leucine-rich repeat (LRR) protein